MPLIECPDCKGSGASGCTYCHGTKKCPDCLHPHDCPTCHAHGTVTCFACDGSGEIADPRSASEREWQAAASVAVVEGQEGLFDEQ